ncbi:MAG: hypothetical protein P8J18_08155 [Halieaceae bacterium]|nr:hypothetical protein [Halieaceae bacterium]
MLPLLYVVRMDVEREYLTEFVKWYDTRHGPDLIGTGFFSCNAYHSVVGEPFICNVYEIPSVEILSSDAYIDVRKNDSQLVNEVLNKISNHSNTTYQQVATEGFVIEGVGGRSVSPSRRTAVNSPVISTTCFDLTSSDEKLLKQFVADYFELKNQPDGGLISLRLAKQSGKHPLFPSSQPEWILLAEWSNLETAKILFSDAPSSSEPSAELHEIVSNKKSNIACLNATLLNPHTWTK